MDEVFERFAHAVDGMACLSGYPHTGRRHEWLDRLEINSPELGVFDELRPQPELGYLTQPPADIRSSGTSISDDDDVSGIAAIARAARAAPIRAAESAPAALAAARQQQDLRAFISLGDAVMLDMSPPHPPPGVCARAHRCH